MTFSNTQLQISEIIFRKSVLIVNWLMGMELSSAIRNVCNWNKDWLIIKVRISAYVTSIWKCILWCVSHAASVLWLNQASCTVNVVFNSYFWCIAKTSGIAFLKKKKKQEMVTVSFSWHIQYLARYRADFPSWDRWWSQQLFPTDLQPASQPGHVCRWGATDAEEIQRLASQERTGMCNTTSKISPSYDRNLFICWQEWYIIYWANQWLWELLYLSNRLGTILSQLHIPGVPSFSSDPFKRRR